MGHKLIQGKGLLDQIQNSNNIPYAQLTEKTISKFMKDLSLKDTFQPRDKKGKFISGPRYYKSEARQYVMMTGTAGMFMFDLAMRGIDLPKGVTYSTVTFKKLPNILYINIGRKEEANKIKINMNDRIYSAYKGTISLGEFDTINKAVKQFKL